MSDQAVENAGGRKQKKVKLDSNSSSSTIGRPSSESDESSDEVQSKPTDDGPLDSLVALENSLPVKRGLSSHYKGKSKSFRNLGDEIGSNNIGKEEHIVNKKRRLLLSQNYHFNKRTLLPQSSSCCSSTTGAPPSPDQNYENELLDDDDKKCGENGDDEQQGKSEG